MPPLIRPREMFAPILFLALHFVSALAVENPVSQIGALPICAVSILEFLTRQVDRIES